MSRTFLFSVLAIGELCSTGVSASQFRHSGAQKSSETFFGYDYSKHGLDWSYGECASRARQSPIDLPAYVPVSKSFEYKYQPITDPLEVMNTGHSYAIDVAGLDFGGVTYDKAFYSLMNINVHSLSEHSWAGLQMPLELHLVHKRYDGDQLLIVAVAVESPTLTGAAMLKAAVGGRGAFLQALSNRSDIGHKLWDDLRGKQAPPTYAVGVPPPPAGPIPVQMGYREPPPTDPMFNPLLQAFLKNPPPGPNMKVAVPPSPIQPYQLNSLLQGGQFYEYAGSLTAPPCAEIATWLVRRDTIKASDRQVMYLHDAIYKYSADFGNYRSLMPLNGREIRMRTALLEQPPPIPPPRVRERGELDKNDREYQTMKWALKAMKTAKSATDYVKDLDSRLRNGAQAHALAIQKKLDPFTVSGQVVMPDDRAAAASGTAATSGKIDMERTAEEMTRTFAAAARKEISDATVEISKRSKVLAIEAAKEAANMANAGGVGNVNALAGAIPGAQPFR